MAKLGSIYGSDGPGPKGQDLHCEVQVPPAAVGHAPGCRVQIPRELPGGGLRHTRAAVAGVVGDELVLHLPQGMPDGAVLRLRGHGAAKEGERAGDLLIAVRIRPQPADGRYLGLVDLHRSRAPVDTRLWVAVAVGLAMAAALIAALLSS